MLGEPNYKNNQRARWYIIMTTGGDTMSKSKKSIIFKKLYGRIMEIYGSINAFAAKAGRNPSTISAKLYGESKITREDMELYCELLDLDLTGVREYFF